MATTAVGQRIRLRYSSTRSWEGVITALTATTDRVHGTFLSDGVNWPDFGSGETNWGIGTQCYLNLDKGTGDMQWQPSGLDAVVGEAVDAKIAAAVPASIAAQPSRGSNVSLALNTPRRPSTTRPTLVIVSGTWTWALTVAGSITGNARLLSDAAATPTTVMVEQPLTQTLTLGVSVQLAGVNPWLLALFVPAGDFYSVAPTGAGTFAITRITEQTL